MIIIVYSPPRSNARMLMCLYGQAIGRRVSVSLIPPGLKAKLSMRRIFRNIWYYFMNPHLSLQIDFRLVKCGGAQTRQRPTATRRRRTRRPAGPSNHTGAQTAKRRKAGSRVTAQNIFRGEGRALNEDVFDEDWKKAGAGFRKQAGR